MTSNLSDDGDLLFNFGDGVVQQEQFDRKELRDLTQSHLIDFLVEFDASHDFVEVKDGDNPNADNPDEIREKYKNGKLILTLAAKYRESRFFFTFQDRADKEVRYVVLICMEELDSAAYGTLCNKLAKKLPHQHASFVRPSVNECIVLNIEQFKKRYGENSVWRQSDFEK